MDLSSLNSSLPPALADAERDMGDKFRAAALNITTMYKNSLTYTKQAYHVGYSAALSDVLNKVQADIGAGEDAATALTRLMDWTEARQTAIKAFEVEDSETPIAPRAQSAAASSSSHRNMTPQRPSSAPIPDGRLRKDGPGPSSLRHENMDADEPSTSYTRPSSSRAPASATTILERSPSETALAPPVPSSSPLPSPSSTRATSSQSLRPQRNTPRVPSSSSLPTSSSFNFALPTSISIPSLELPPASGPAQTGPIGSKRPMIDVDMAEGPSSSARGQGRHATKRRNMVHGAQGAQDGEEKERSNERRRGRRGAGGGGHAPSA